MRITRASRLAAVAAAGVLALAACSESGTSSQDTSSAPTNIDCKSGTLSGEGSSFQKNAVFEWTKLYQTACPDATINYNPTGSGAGVSQFLSGQVDWAGSDSALKEDEGEYADAKTRCNNNDAWNLPMVGGAVAITYNVPGVDNLVVTADVAGEIFLGKITKWNDAKIAALNPDAALPDAAITVFFRADESGTTDNFTKYLNTAAPKVWTAEPGKAWPDGAAGEGKPQSSGILDAVGATENSISYLDYSDVLAGGLQSAAIDTGNGPVQLTQETATAGLAAATISGTGNDLVLDLDRGTSEPGVYPAVAVSYEIVCSAGLEPAQADLLKSFLTFTASEEGQAALPDLGYVRLPAEVDTRVQAAVAALS